jgi:hypothetical protein
MFKITKKGDLPNSSSKTLANGARQLVVQEALLQRRSMRVTDLQHILVLLLKNTPEDLFT